MKNYVSAGDSVTLIAPGGGVVSGLGYLIGSIFGVAAVSAAATEEFEAKTAGVFDLAKTAAQAWAQGDSIYYNEATGLLDNVPTVGPCVGAALRVEANPTATGRVRLNGAFLPKESEGPQAAIADMVAISGGESPTEAEHNLVITKMNAVLAAMRAGGLILP